MTEYRVRWEIDSDGDDPIDAARQARQRQTDPDTTAVVFAVCPADDPLEARWDIVDLMDPDPDGHDPIVNWEYGHKALFEMAKKLVADGGDLDAVMEMLEKPSHWPELLSAVTLDRAFDAVSPGEDEPDVSIEDEPEHSEYVCQWCGADLTVDGKGPMSTGYWVDVEKREAICPKNDHGSGMHGATKWVAPDGE